MKEKLLSSRQKWSTVGHGIAFILGFSIIFILLGLTFSVLGGWLYNIRDVLAKIGGMVIVFIRNPHDRDFPVQIS